MRNLLSPLRNSATRFFRVTIICILMKNMGQMCRSAAPINGAISLRESNSSDAKWRKRKMPSPFQFFQFFLNLEDEAVEELLLKLTLIPYGEVESIMLAHHKDPASRTAQKELARAVTTLVHGVDSSENAENVSDVLFGAKTLEEVSEDARELLAKEAPSAGIKLGVSIVDALVVASLASSKREARQFIEDGAVSLAGDAIKDVNRVLEESDFQNGLALLKRGKRNASVLILD